MKTLFRVFFIMGIATIVSAPHYKSDLITFTVNGSYTTNDTMLIAKFLRLDALLKDPVLWDKMERKTNKEIYKSDTIKVEYMEPYVIIYPDAYVR